MADYINIEATFNGTATFVAYDCVGPESKPIIRIRCADENGKTARGDMWCTEKAKPYTVEKLRALGVEGVTDDNVLDNAEQLSEAPCTFDTEQRGEYFNATNIRGLGDASGGGGGTGNKSEFMAKVFGSAAPAEPSADVGPNF
jgi:hypothetical protein